jgi:uncharacterized damage-inducible protein DinB
MSEIERIVDQIDRAYAGDAWHGPALRHLLGGVSAEDASKHPIAHGHSIWEIVNHIASWQIIVRRRIAGEVVEPTPDTDWPPVWEATEIAWRRSLENLDDAHNRLRGVVEHLQEQQLLSKTPGKQDSIYVTLHGVIQHDLYHAGQIAILKKALP